MAEPWHVRVYDNQQPAYAGDCPGPLELGRQAEGEQAPYAQGQEAGRWRLVIARSDEDSVSRRHVLVEALKDGRVRLTNLSAKLPIFLSDGREVRPGGASEVALPVLLTLGRKAVRIEAAAPAPLQLRGLPEATRPPGHVPVTRAGLTSLPAAPGLDREALVRWLHATMGVLQAAAASLDFLPRAAQAIVELVGLDSGRVLLWEGGEWRTQVLRTAPGPAGESSGLPSRQVLARVRDEKRTFWQTPGPIPDASSLAGVRAVVAAPVLDGKGEVIGALYGDRRQDGLPGSSRALSQTEAMLVELIAGGVAAGLARLEQERAAVAATVRFEQFFTRKLALRLAANPDLLKGRNALVSILFADIRGFSRVSRRVGPAVLMEWVGDVMGALSDCVLAHDGTLVDYIGDELMAMWGAPDEQPDHAALACRAALAMLEQISVLNARWQTVLGEPMSLGVGIDTGITGVGQTGSRHKFKYGPLGDTANRASRVQGATRYFQTRALITAATQLRLDGGFATRKLGRVRLVNMDEPVTLHELGHPAVPEWGERKQTYESALREFEAGDPQAAARTVTRLLAQYADDGPAAVLMQRLGDASPNPVWELPGK